MLAKKIGRRIRQLRRERGLSLAELAFESEPDMTRFHLSHIERGTRLPSVRVLFGLAERLDVEPFELLLVDDAGRAQITEMVRQLPGSRADDLRRALDRELGRG